MNQLRANEKASKRTLAIRTGVRAGDDTSKNALVSNILKMLEDTAKSTISNTRA